MISVRRRCCSWFSRILEQAISTGTRKRALVWFLLVTSLLATVTGCLARGEATPQTGRQVQSAATASAPTTTAPSPAPAVTAPAGPSPTKTPVSPAATPGEPDDYVIPFRDASRDALGRDRFINNPYPGVALFDYDRDGDLDIYVTSAEVNGLFAETVGGPNKLFRNDGTGKFEDVAQAAGVAIPESNSSGVVACDINNDGYQDLYVGAMGRIGDRLDYRSARAAGLSEVIKDRLFLNRKDGTFRDITLEAFGDAVNLRSAASPACADVDLDGWVDIFVGNRADQDFVTFADPAHHGHYNVMYRNNGNLTFTDVTGEAGLLGPGITMRDPDGVPIKFKDRASGKEFEGYDPQRLDARGNRVGDPTGQTWAVLFFDHDDDGDQDLWLADDGDRLKFYRNDSSPGRISFTSVGRAMGVDQSGAWMGFAQGDYDGDGDLDVFITNIGFHPLTRGLPTNPGGDCAYAHQFGWGTCFHYLLRNDGVRAVPGLGTVPVFAEVAGSTQVEPSRFMPPKATDPASIQPHWEVPTGLAAYDFGFGTAFFDLENDGDEDLYWLGSMIARGEGPGGDLYPGPGRLLRNRGRAGFEDVTVEARVLDIQNVDYSVLDPADPRFDQLRQRIDPRFHENGRGVAKGDLNGDGYVDLVATNAGSLIFARTPQGVAYTPGPIFVWLNGGGQNNWLTLRLRGRMSIDGTGSNADALGARVVVEAKTGGGRTSTLVQEVTAGASFMSANSLDLYFGLGRATLAERVRVIWPSGVSQVIENVPANQALVVTEPPG
jgi:hypothetical protein